MNVNKLPYTIKNYWINVAGSFLIATAVNLITGLFLGTEIAGVIYIGVAIYWVIIEVRRFHDANRTGWLALLNLIPLLGTITALIVAGMLRSNYENNKWLNS